VNHQDTKTKNSGTTKTQRHKDFKNLGLHIFVVSKHESITMSHLTHLECSRCGETLDPAQLWNLCPRCRSPLFARYDLAAAGRTLRPEHMAGRPANLWRYAEILPVQDPAFRLTLGEGWTPLLPARRLGEALGLSHLTIKEEGLNPTGSFKARGMAVAVSRAWELGAPGFTLPSAGNAGGALAAYAAQAGRPARVFLPRATPRAFFQECAALGAQVTAVPGHIGDAGRAAREEAIRSGFFLLSTLQEPYRVEGKKTMAFELVEQLGSVPDVIVYPAGGGTGIVGMWKGFAEMQALGWIGAERPRLALVQAAGCAPLVRAFVEGAEHAIPWEDPATVALGLRVPSAIADFLILRAVRESNGTAVAVGEEAIRAGWEHLGRSEGILAAPEGGAALAGLEALVYQGWVRPEERVVLFNTGSGYKYM
jgi:threonine synthase